MKQSIAPSIQLRFYSIFLGLLALMCPFANSLFTSHAMHFKAAIGVPLICLFAFVWALFSIKNKLFKFTRAYLPLGGFILWSTLSISWSTSIYENIYILIPWAATILGFFLVYNLMKNEEDVKFLLVALFVAGFSVALIGIIQHLLSWKLIMQAAPPSSTFGNKNFASQFIVLVFPIGLGLLYDRDRFSWIYLLMFCSMIAFLSYTKTRGSWVAISLELALFALFILYKNRFKIKGLFSFDKTFFSKLGVSIAFLAIMVNMGPDGFKWRSKELIDRAVSVGTQASIQSTSGNNRLPIWANTWEMIKDYPLTGVGLGNWIVEFHKYHGKSVKVKEFGKTVYPTHLHNDLLEIFSNLGLIGILLLLWLFVQLIKMEWRPLKNREGMKALFTFAPFCGIIGITLNSNFSFPFFNFYPLLILLTYVAIVCHLFDKEGHQKDVEKDHSHEVAIRKTVAVPLSILFVSLAVFSGFYGHYLVRGEYNYYYGHAVLKNNNARGTPKSWRHSIRHCIKGLKIPHLYYHPYKSKFLFNCSVAYRKFRRYNKAISLAKEALHLRPYDMYVYNLLFQLYFESRVYSKAKDMAKRLIDLFPTAPYGYEALARVYRKSGLAKSAGELFAKARSLR